VPDRDQWPLKLRRALGFRGQGVRIWVILGLKGQKNIEFESSIKNEEIRFWGQKNICLKQASETFEISFRGEKNIFHIFSL